MDLTNDLDTLIAHAGHPILRWMASNVSVKTDAAGNIKPDKKTSSEKIDGIVALTMAIGRLMAEPPHEQSVYETRGLWLLTRAADGEVAFAG